MKLRSLLATLPVALMAQCAPQCAPVPPPPPPPTEDVSSSYGEAIGYSVQGRPILAERHGDGPTTVVIVGQIHGNERAPLALNDAVRAFAWDNSLTVWLIPTLNVDGAAVGQRRNANGVDLNRDGQAMQAPESRALRDFVASVGATLVVHVHGPLAEVGFVGGALSEGIAREYRDITQTGWMGYVGSCSGTPTCLWHGHSGEKVVLEFPAIDSTDTTSATGGRVQSNPDHVRWMADVFVQVLDRRM